MDILAEILIYFIFMFGLWLFHWCMRHKNVTLTIVAIIMMVVDVFVWLKFTGRY